MLTLAFKGFCFPSATLTPFKTSLNEQKQLTDQAGLILSIIPFISFAGSMQGLDNFYIPFTSSCFLCRMYLEKMCAKHGDQSTHLEGMNVKFEFYFYSTLAIVSIIATFISE